MCPRTRSRRLIRPRQPRSFRPLLEGLENRLAPAGLGVTADPTALAFDPLSGTLSLLGNMASVGTRSNGSLTVTLNGQSHASDAALAGVNATTLRAITLSNAGNPTAL